MSGDVVPSSRLVGPVTWNEWYWGNETVMDYNTLEKHAELVIKGIEKQLLHMLHLEH